MSAQQATVGRPKWVSDSLFAGAEVAVGHQFSRSPMRPTWFGVPIDKDALTLIRRIDALGKSKSSRCVQHDGKVSMQFDGKRYNLPDIVVAVASVSLPGSSGRTKRTCKTRLCISPRHNYPTGRLDCSE